MTGIELIGTIAGPVGVVIAAAIAIITKRTPERKSSSEILQEDMNILMKRIEALEDSNTELWGDVENLRKRVSSLWGMVETARSYIHYLEAYMHRNGVERPTRPADVEHLMTRE